MDICSNNENLSFVLFRFCLRCFFLGGGGFVLVFCFAFCFVSFCFVFFFFYQNFCLRVLTERKGTS